jgi:hypothetical protein
MLWDLNINKHAEQCKKQETLILAEYLITTIH